MYLWVFLLFTDCCALFHLSTGRLWPKHNFCMNIPLFLQFQPPPVANSQACYRHPFFLCSVHLVEMWVSSLWRIKPTWNKAIFALIYATCPRILHPNMQSQQWSSLLFPSAVIFQIIELDCFWALRKGFQIAEENYTLENHLYPDGIHQIWMTFSKGWDPWA